MWSTSATVLLIICPMKFFANLKKKQKRTKQKTAKGPLIQSFYHDFKHNH